MKLLALMSLAALASAAAPPAATETIAGIQVGAWTKAAYGQAPTECDRLAAYAPDRDAVAPPVAHEQIGLPRAIRACRQAIAREPANPRFHYQIARLLGYADDPAGAQNERLVAARAGYPSALYVLGFMRAFSDPVTDRCGGAQLMRISAERGAFAGQVGLANYQLAGKFDGCAAAADKATLLAMLDTASHGAKGHFEDLLVASLRRETARLP